MKKENNISTKDKLIKNFSKEQMEIYNYYKNKFENNDEELYPIVSEDKELTFLENSCKIFTKILKVEIVMGLLIATFVFMFGGISNKNTQIKYKGQINPVQIHIKYNPKA